MTYKNKIMIGVELYHKH